MVTNNTNYMYIDKLQIRWRRTQFGNSIVRPIGLRRIKQEIVVSVYRVGSMANDGDYDMYMYVNKGIKVKWSEGTRVINTINIDV